MVQEINNLPRAEERERALHLIGGQVDHIIGDAGKELRDGRRKKTRRQKKSILKRTMQKKGTPPN